MIIRKTANLLIVLFLVAFIVCSVYGAFIGAQQARAFFNSPVLIVFWCLLLVFMLAGFAVYASLRKRYSLLLIHLGFLLVLAGGMIGSDMGLHISNQFIDPNIIPTGVIQLRPGHSSHLVETDTGVGELPFSIRLKDAFVEYYDEPVIQFSLSAEQVYTIPLELGEAYELPDDLGTIQIIGVYKNFKMRKQDGQMKPYDSPEPGSNPAYELVFSPAGQPSQQFFVFERFGMHAMPGQTFRADFIRPHMIKDYKSILEVVNNGKIVKQKTIEVNKPLFYGGYHFYQNTFTFDQHGPVSGIQVAASTGVWTVFFGYGVIFAGLTMHFWNKLRRKTQTEVAGGAE